MGVIAALAVLRVHVLVVELPGHPLLRLRAEAAVRARGWVLVAEAEDADLLLVCGAARSEALDALWSRVPAPRVRRTVASRDELPEALDSAARVLADDALQRAPADRGGTGPHPLHSAGFVLDTAVDARGVVTALGVRRLQVEAEEEDDALDPSFLLAVAQAARLLRLAGWAALALRLDRVVDLALAGRPAERLAGRLRRVVRIVDRSVTLRMLVQEVPGVDVRGRLLALLGAAVAGVDPPAPPARRLIGTPASALPIVVAATEPVAGHG